MRTSSSKAPACYYPVTLKNVGKNVITGGDIRTVSGTLPVCLQNHVITAWNTCAQKYGEVQRNDAGTVKGNTLKKDPHGPNGFDECMVDYMNKNVTGKAGWDKTVNLDANCNKVSTTSGLQWCGSVSLYWNDTPVSLIWDDKAPVSAKAVQFPFDPKNPNLWYIWKASKSAPLLVWLKDGKKSVTSIEQLFGQKTFARAWKDGFEALASLDKNQDGIISGDELDELALWFDVNQNGVAEPSEIKTLKEAGVTALYYNKDGNDARTGDIYVSRGYTRVTENGRTVTGAAVDWMSKTGYATRQEAEAAIAGEEASDDGQLSSWSGFGGTWAWTLDYEFIKEGAVNTNGMVLLAEGSGGQVKGLSLSEVQVQPAPDGTNSIMRGVLLSGKKVIDRGVEKISLSTTDQNGLITEVIAELSGDGKLMFGTTRSEVYLGQNKTQKQTIHYTWKAVRY